MSTTPANFQDAGERAVQRAARAILRARNGFPNGLSFALKAGVSHDRILEICAEEGIDFAEVRALLEIGDVA